MAPTAHDDLWSERWRCVPQLGTAAAELRGAAWRSGLHVLELSADPQAALLASRSSLSDIVWRGPGGLLAEAKRRGAEISPWGATPEWFVSLPEDVTGRLWSLDPWTPLLRHHRESFHEEALRFGRQLLADLPPAQVPPTVVLDIARLTSGGFVVLEVNDVWSSGLYGCDSGAVLTTLITAREQTGSQRALAVDTRPGRSRPRRAHRAQELTR